MTNNEEFSSCRNSSEAFDMETFSVSRYLDKQQQHRGCLKIPADATGGRCEPEQSKSQFNRKSTAFLLDHERNARPSMSDEEKEEEDEGGCRRQIYPVPGSPVSTDSAYQPLANLSKLVECAHSATTEETKDVQTVRDEIRLSSIPTAANQRFNDSVSCPRNNLISSDRRSAASHKDSKSGIGRVETRDRETPTKRSVFSITDILDPQFGLKAPPERKRARRISVESDAPDMFFPYIPNGFSLRLPAMHPMASPYTVVNPQNFLHNDHTLIASKDFYSNIEKENAARYYKANNFHKLQHTTQLYQHLFRHHPSMGAFSVPYLVNVATTRPPTPPLERYPISVSFGDARCQISPNLISPRSPPKRNEDTLENSRAKLQGQTNTNEHLNNLQTKRPTCVNFNHASAPMGSNPTERSSAEQGETSTEPNKTSTPSRPSNDGREDRNSSQVPQKLWPAWVYCTRYSDRPSSGPRTRKPRRKQPRSSSESIPKKASSSSSSSSTADDKRPRTAFNQEQLTVLKREFAGNQYLTEERRTSLSTSLGLNESQIKIWFQNKRAKLKKSSGIQNRLAVELMAQGLYNHSTMKSSQQQSTVTSPSSSSSRSPVVC